MMHADSEKTKRTIGYLIFSAFLLSLIIRIFLTAIRRFDPDEFEHLHASWMIYSGFLPYLDFWQNHTPLLWYLIAPAFRLFGEGIPAIFIVRSILSASSFLILWLTYLLARLDHDRFTSILSAMVLSCSYIFLHKTIEVRPDQFLIILWLGSLFLALRSMRDQKNSSTIFIAGVLLGTSMLFTPKALVCLAAIFLTFAANWIVLNRFKGFLETVKILAVYGLGFLVPLAIFSAIFYRTGALGFMIETNILDNLTFPHQSRTVYLLSLRQIVLFMLCFAGLALSFQRGKWHKEKRILIAIPMLFLILIFLFYLPAPNQQSILLFAPLMAIFGGIAFKRCIDSYSVSASTSSVALLTLAFLAGVLIPCISAVYEKASTSTNSVQLERIAGILKLSSRRDVFFDGNHAYVFRPQAFYYGFLIPEIRSRIERGVIRESIPQNLIRKRCKFVIYDDRVSLLPDNIQNFIRNNYIPAGIPDVYAAGKELGAENFSGRRAVFRIDIPLSYEISISNSTSFLLDGKPYRDPVLLNAGTHLILSEKRLQQVVIRAVTK